MLASVLMRPVSLAVLLGVASIAVATAGSAEPSGLSRRRLSFALAGVAIAAVIAAAVSAYVSPDEARKFGVAEEHRWPAIWNQFVISGVLGVYIGIAGASVVGIPLASFMASKGFATTPWFVSAAAVISLVLAIPFAMHDGSPRGVAVIAFLVGGHSWLAIGFALGARLPWRLSKVSPHVA